jgi:ankyrin repeat protein
MTIFEAIRAYDVKAVQRLLKKDPHLARRNCDDFQTPLHCALCLLPTHIERYASTHIEEKSHQEKQGSAIISLLLPLSKINATDSQGETALHIVIRRELKNWVEPLFQRGANLNVQNNNGDTPLHLMVIQSIWLFHIMDFLKTGANPNLENKQGKTPFALSTDMHTNQLLLKFGAHIPKNTPNQEQYLNYALEEGLENVVVSILKTRAQVLSTRTLKNLIEKAPQTTVTSTVDILLPILKARHSLLKAVKKGNIPTVTKLLNECPGKTFWSNDSEQHSTIFEAGIMTRNVALLDCLFIHYKENVLSSKENLYYSSVLAGLLFFSIQKNIFPVFVYLLNRMHGAIQYKMPVFEVALEADNKDVALFVFRSQYDNPDFHLSAAHKILCMKKISIFQKCLEENLINTEMLMSMEAFFIPTAAALLVKQAFLSALIKKAVIRMNDDAFFDQEAEVVIQITDIAVQASFKTTIPHYSLFQLKKHLPVANIPLEYAFKIPNPEFIDNEGVESLPVDAEEKYSQLTVVAEPNTILMLY